MTRTSPTLAADSDVTVMSLSPFSALPLPSRMWTQFLPMMPELDFTTLPRTVTFFSFSWVFWAWISATVFAFAPEAALADAQGNPRGVVLWRDELTAWLANLGRYASGGSDRAHWLEAWSAAGVTVMAMRETGVYAWCFLR